MCFYLMLSYSVQCSMWSMFSVQSVTVFSAQSSTLEPLLFLLYINNLENAFKHCANHHFTEDTELLYANNNIQNIGEIMNAEKDLLTGLRLVNSH